MGSACASLRVNLSIPTILFPTFRRRTFSNRIGLAVAALFHPVQRADLVAVRVTQVSEVVSAGTSSTQTRRILAGSAAGSQAGLMERMNLLRARCRKTDRAAIGMSGRLAIYRLVDPESEATATVKISILVALGHGDTVNSTLPPPIPSSSNGSEFVLAPTESASAIITHALGLFYLECTRA